ncbi:MAG: hypothetical protein GX608_05095 [Lentisphaerae bacterium]|nr:hypothetical protein [Lentisphaerota bacterium]
MPNKPTSREQPATASAARWTGRSRGGYYGNLFFIHMLRMFGLRAAFLPLPLVCAYYLLAYPAARRASTGYLTRLLGPLSAWRRARLVHRHFVSMGRMLIERMAMIADPSSFQCAFEGVEHLRNALGQGRGLVLVSAHVGNWEAAGHLLGGLGAPVNVVGVNREVESIRHLFDRQMSNKAFRFLPVEGSPLDTIALLAALRRNEIVAVHGDRATGDDTLERPFLGRPARFPTGAYRLAAAAGAPVVQGFSVRERLRCYRFMAYPAMTPPPDPAERDAFIGGCIGSYVERLEALVRRYPFQWYNFYPFWD